MKRREKGFTVPEVLIGVAIMAIVVVAVAMTITTLLLNEGQAAGQNTALPQVQNAGYWISRDVQMARIVTLGEPGVFLRLDIPMDDNPEHDYSIDYSFDGDKLKRKGYDSSEILISETLIAAYIDTDNTTFSALGYSLYKLTITAAEGEAVLTRSYQVKQRLSPS